MPLTVGSTTNEHIQLVLTQATCGRFITLARWFASDVYASSFASAVNHLTLHFDRQFAIESAWKLLFSIQIDLRTPASHSIYKLSAELSYRGVVARRVPSSSLSGKSGHNQQYLGMGLEELKKLTAAHTEVMVPGDQLNCKHWLAPVLHNNSFLMKEAHGKCLVHQ